MNSDNRTSTLLRRVGRAARVITVFILTFVGSTVLGQSDRGGYVAEVLLDASSSMAGANIDLARETIVEYAETLWQENGNAVQLCLRTIGEREGSSPCYTSMLVPIGPIDLPELRRVLDGVQPAGNTALALGLTSIITDLAGTERATVLVVSDGRNNCDGDPCEVASRIADLGKDFVFALVSLGIDSVGASELRCTAEVLEGEYFELASDDDETLRSVFGRVADQVSEDSIGSWVHQIKKKPLSDQE